MSQIKSEKIAKGIKKITNQNGKTFFQVIACKRAVINGKTEKFELKRKADSKIKAEKLLAVLYQEIGKMITLKSGAGKTWREVVFEWSEYNKKTNYEKISESTVQDYLSLIKNWTSNWRDIPAKDISRQMVRIAIEKIKRERSIKHTAKLKDAIKNVFQWGIDQEVIKEILESPTEGISVSRKTTRRTDVFTDEMARTFLNKAQSMNHPWFPVWLMAINTGMRSGELYALNWTNIDLDRKLIKVSDAYKAKTKKIGTTKTGEERFVPINDDLLELLNDLKNKTFETGFVLPRLKDWDNRKQALVLRAFCESINIKPIRFHSLRATFTTLLLSKGIGLNLVQAMGGWKDIATMNHYNRMTGLLIEDATSSLNLMAKNEVCRPMSKIV
jgi:integrase